MKEGLLHTLDSLLQLDSDEHAELLVAALQSVNSVLTVGDSMRKSPGTRHPYAQQLREDGLLDRVVDLINAEVEAVSCAAGDVESDHQDLFLE